MESKTETKTRRTFEPTHKQQHSHHIMNAEKDAPSSVIKLVSMRNCVIYQGL